MFNNQKKKKKLNPKDKEEASFLKGFSQSQSTQYKCPFPTVQASTIWFLKVNNKISASKNVAQLYSHIGDGDFLEHIN